jgi:CheY-like chemotaxis protein
MNAIIGMAKIAEGTEDIEKLKYCLSMIDVSSSHLLGIINDILDMSKIESGKFELEYVPLNIEKILMKIKNILNEQAEKKKIDLSVINGTKTNMWYIGDELRLTHIIINIVSNAITFTPSDGKVMLSVNEKQKGDGFDILKFTVSDTGIGITEEQRSKLFNAFGQADGSISTKYGGTGLGLTISKNIVEKMGGVIWVDSEPGKGSTFAFELKFECAGQKEEEISVLSEQILPAAKTVPSDSKPPDFSGVTLLLAEDVEINREIFISLLENTNVMIDTAENGVEAVQKFKNDPYKYAAIVMDIQMPVMNGYEATKTIRALDIKRARSIPIIALSADAFKEDMAKCMECGMNDHLKKPIELDKVIEILSYYIKT